MGKKSRSRWKAEQEKLNRLPQDWRGNPVAGARTQAEADRIYGIGHQIENCMCDAIVGNVLDMGIGCPESFVGLNPAIQIHMSSAPPHRQRMA